MSNLIAIIYVIFIWIFIKAFIKKSRGAGKPVGRQWQNTTQGESKRENTAQYTGTKSMTASTGNIGSKSKPSANVFSASEKDCGEGSSVTEYLAEKARKDQIEHAKEKQLESQRLAEKSGGLTPAERLYDGDPVPAGKFCVCCSYCAAENLIPIGNRIQYSCYFCREPLH